MPYYARNGTLDHRFGSKAGHQDTFCIILFTFVHRCRHNYVGCSKKAIQILHVQSLEMDPVLRMYPRRLPKLGRCFSTVLVDGRRSLQIVQSELKQKLLESSRVDVWAAGRQESVVFHQSRMWLSFNHSTSFAIETSRFNDANIKVQGCSRCSHHLCLSLSCRASQSHYALQQRLRGSHFAWDSPPPNNWNKLDWSGEVQPTQGGEGLHGIHMGATASRCKGKTQLLNILFRLSLFTLMNR